MPCLPDNLRDREYYHPTKEGLEQQLQKRMEEIRRKKTELRVRKSENEKG